MATEKQKRAVANLAENGGNIGQAMRDAGYSEVSSLTPKKLTASKGFKELLDEYLPEHLLLERHKQLIEHIDGQISARAVDMGYKLRGSYAPEKTEHSGAIATSPLTQDQIDAIIARRAPGISTSGPL